MIVIWGSRNTKKVLGNAGVYTCTHCQRAIIFQVIRVRTWFTLFWIPIFPYSNKYFVMCPTCSNGYDITKAEALQELAKGSGQPAA